MLKRLLALLIFCLVLLLLSRLSFFKSWRNFLETELVLSVYRPQKQPQVLESLQALSLKEQVSKLKKENQVLRTQLGAIPERSNLIPATVVWETAVEFTLSFPYPQNSDLIGHPVIYENFYLGKVKRLGSSLVVVEKPVSSGFVAEGESEARVKGRLKGRFNEQVIFEVPVNAKVNRGDKIYLLNREYAWRFLVGEVSEVVKNARLPVKEAIVNYLPNKAPLTTVFVVE